MNSSLRLCAIGFVAGMALWAAACSDLGQEPAPPFDPGAAGQTIGGTELTWSKDGRRSAVIQARILTRLADGDEVTLQDSVKMYVYDDDGALAAIVTGDIGVINDTHKTARVDSAITVRFLGDGEHGAVTLTADAASADDRTKDIVASGSVLVVSDEGVRLQTERLIWEGRTQRFRTPGFVRITNGSEVEEGTDLIANADLTEYTMQEIRGRTTRAMDEVRETLGRQPDTLSAPPIPEPSDGR
jgi:hypothetical protein